MKYARSAFGLRRGQSESRRARPRGTLRRGESRDATVVEERERKLLSAVAAVEARERALRAAEELAQQGSWMWEVGSSSVSWSDQVHRILGTDAGGEPITYDGYLSM